ncbi:hypothetical protein CHH60_23000 [Paenibacillus sp. 7523-1]|nr:hypothetical protein CHH60_23000 [Paenibacillus sp. 7523-1]
MQTEEALCTGNALLYAGFHDSYWLTLGCYLDAKVKWLTDWIFRDASCDVNCRNQIVGLFFTEMI